MIRYAPFSAFLWLLIASLAPAQQRQPVASEANRILLGRLADGAAVTFVRAGSGRLGHRNLRRRLPAHDAAEARAGRGLPR